MLAAIAILIVFSLLPNESHAKRIIQADSTIDTHYSVTYNQKARRIRVVNDAGEELASKKLRSMKNPKRAQLRVFDFLTTVDSKDEIVLGLLKNGKLKLYVLQYNASTQKLTLEDKKTLTRIRKPFRLKQEGNELVVRSFGEKETRFAVKR